MCLGKIGNVNVVANAGAVGRIVIGSVDRNAFSLSVRNLKNKRNEMAFGIMSLTELTALVSTAGIEWLPSTPGRAAPDFPL